MWIKKGLEIIITFVLVVITLSAMTAMQISCWLVPEGY